RRNSFSSLTEKSTTIGFPNPLLSRMRSSCLACGRVLGNPSNTKPPAQSGRDSLSSTILITRSSGTSSPLSMIGRTFLPSSVPWLTASRNMSPVDRCGTPQLCATRFDWVPLPAPGGPRKIKACLRPIVTARPRLSTATTPHPALPYEPFVIPHHELRFQLLHGVHGYAHDDQQ